MVKWKIKVFHWIEMSEWSTDRQNHDLDVTTIGATIGCHGTPLHEIPCRFGNCKACYRPGLSGIKWPPILVRNRHIPVAMSFSLIFAEY